MTSLIPSLLAATALLSAAEATPPVREPSNATEQARPSGTVAPTTEQAYQAWKSSRTAAEQAWVVLLEQQLGPFYLPLFKADKAAGKVTAWDWVEDDPRLPRVLLIGDSISRGYTLTVRETLQGKANVHRAPCNCGGTARGLKDLDTWLAGGKWSVIHVNFGIHDRALSDEAYVKNLRTLVGRLKATGARLIWARTTPPADATNREQFTPQRFAQLNALSDALMAAEGIPLNDLEAAVKPRLAELQRPHDVHFTDAGYRVLGQQVAKAITARLQP